MRVPDSLGETLCEMRDAAVHHFEPKHGISVVEARLPQALHAQCIRGIVIYLSDKVAEVQVMILAPVLAEGLDTSTGKSPAKKDRRQLIVVGIVVAAELGCRQRVFQYAFERSREESR